jgi:hypothetical protein
MSCRGQQPQLPCQFEVLSAKLSMIDGLGFNRMGLMINPILFNPFQGTLYKHYFSSIPPSLYPTLIEFPGFQNTWISDVFQNSL